MPHERRYFHTAHTCCTVLNVILFELVKLRTNQDGTIRYVRNQDPGPAINRALTPIKYLQNTTSGTQSLKFRFKFCVLTPSFCKIRSPIAMPRKIYQTITLSESIVHRGNEEPTGWDGIGSGGNGTGRNRTNFIIEFCTGPVSSCDLT